MYVTVGKCKIVNLVLRVIPVHYFDLFGEVLHRREEEDVKREAEECERS